MSGTSVSSNDLDGKVVVVVVKACKEISKNALVWALTHIVQPGDSILLLVVLPDYSSSKKMWDIVRLTGDCANVRSFSGSRLEIKNDITELCSQMVSELHSAYNHLKFEIDVKVISRGVAKEVKNAKSNWVILDKHLKEEKKCCMEELDCNVVAMKKAKPKVLRLNLTNSTQSEKDPSLLWTLDLELSSQCEEESIKGPSVSPVTSPEPEFSCNGTEIGTSSISSSDPGASPFLVLNTRKTKLFLNHEDSRSVYDSESEQDTTKELFCWNLVDAVQKHSQLGIVSTSNGFSPTRDSNASSPTCSLDFAVRKSLREAISLSSNTPLGPPPLCSLCRHKSPAFGNPPRWFSYSELDSATNGFSRENFLAEGGFGSVHRGVLSDGQMVAVKQHRLASSHGDLEFCSEVEVLSCAQHRNVVTLIGLCIEDGRRLLVYEYICNGSLDARLFGQGKPVLAWSSRQKIAVGASRGLRYLHEECRVGCIVHRDMRPNNILITHDFEPLVGDFGLARWQPDGDKGVETRVLGTFGYLAPEYAQTGQITDKADVYSFGVVLLELVTGKKAIDLNRPKGQQCLTEWARPLLAKHSYDELIDPRLGSRYSVREAHNMLRCSSLCIQRDPIPRPRISQVLRMLEGYVVIDS